MIKVYGRATSGNVQLVVWALAELGVPFERIDAGFGFGGTDTPEYLAMNPNGLVPAFQDEHVTMFESAAIVRYVAARHGRFPFWPEDPVARAPIDMWAEWAKSTLHPSFLLTVFWPALQDRFDPESEASRKALAGVERNLDILEGRLGDGPWLLGADFTAADLPMGTMLFRYYTVDIPRPDRPRLAAYYERLKARPAYAEHVMVPLDSLKAMPR